MTTTVIQRSRWSTLYLSVFMTAALAACGGDDSGSTNTGGGGGGGGVLGIAEEGCLDECKKFLNQLAEEFATKGVASRQRAVAAVPRVNGDTIEFDVASTPLDDKHPGELSAAFPVSGTDLAYLLTVNKATGVITIDNKKGKTFTLKAFDEANYYQEIDYAKTDMADKNKSHYAYVSFNPKVKANVIQKGAELRRQWKNVDGSDNPTPGVSFTIRKPWQDCPGQQSSCDVVMLTTNPSEKGDEGNEGVPPADLGGDKGVTGHVNGTQKKVTGPTAMATNGVGGTIAIQGIGTSLGSGNWGLLIQPEKGVQDCNTRGVYIQYSTLGGIDAWTSVNNSGTCSITVSTLTATEVAGTFTADLGPGDGNTDKSRRTITKGAFHLTR